jgi:CheY-like chemotaxis protein
MDMHMPVMDGFTATRTIRALEMQNAECRERSGREHVRKPGKWRYGISSAFCILHSTIIAISASVFEQDREHILAAGCDDFVSKPFRESTIVEKIEHFLGVRFAYEGDEETTPADAVGAELAEKSSALPKPLLVELNDAAVQGDLEAASVLLEKIGQHCEG